MIYSGIITDVNGNPVSGSGIAFVNDAGQRITSMATDSAGRWQVDDNSDSGLFNPGVNIVFGAPGYGEYSIATTSLQPVFNVKLEKLVNVIFPWMIALVLAAVLLYTANKKKRGRKVGKLSTSDLMPIFLLVGGVIGFTLIKKILEKTGVWQDSNDKKVTEISADGSSFWNPSYWQQFSSYSYAITEDQAKQLSYLIYTGMGLFSDDAAQVKGAFRSLKTKANASYLAFVFKNVTGKDLFTYLKDGYTSFLPWNGLSSADLVDINNYLQSLPTN